jgi:hypothetical protein
MSVFSPQMDSTHEHRLRLPMPWKRRAYCINTDDMRRGRPLLMAVWWFEFGCFFMRCGWTHDWDVEVKIESITVFDPPSGGTDVFMVTRDEYGK